MINKIIECTPLEFLLLVIGQWVSGFSVALGLIGLGIIKIFYKETK